MFLRTLNFWIRWGWMSFHPFRTSDKLWKCSQFANTTVVPCHIQPRSPTCGYLGLKPTPGDTNQVYYPVLHIQWSTLGDKLEIDTLGNVETFIYDFLNYMITISIIFHEVFCEENISWNSLFLRTLFFLKIYFWKLTTDVQVYLKTFLEADRLGLVLSVCLTAHH